MAECKRYYWLRLHDDFFDSKRIKKLRGLAGGDTYTIIYLKMQLKAMKTEGVLTFTNLEDDMAKELALDLDEKEDDVRMTLMYLLKVGLAETSDDINYFFPYSIENTGSETASTQRWREWKKKNKVLDSNKSPTQLQQNANVESYIEKEIEKDNRERVNADSHKVPSSEEIDEYIKAKNYSVNAGRFLAYYKARGWKAGKDEIHDWKALVDSWQTKEKETRKMGTFDTNEFFEEAIKKTYQQA